MSSSTGMPTGLLENLTIDTQMSSGSTDVRTRALEIRDILSSFDRDVLPSEFKPQIFSQLDRPLAHRTPVSQWTIQEDLPGTLLQWGVYNDKAYDMLKSLQSTSTLARCFHEKIARRLRQIFVEYDQLPNDYNNVRSGIQRVAQGLRDIVAAIKEDRRHRDVAASNIASQLLTAMADVCRRHKDLVPPLQSPSTPRRGTRRSTQSMNDNATNLFEVLIKPSVEDERSEPFMLDVLETFPDTIWRNLEQECANLISLLDINRAPALYKYRIGRLASSSRIAEVGSSGARNRAENVTVSSTLPVSREPSNPLAHDDVDDGDEFAAQNEHRVDVTSIPDPAMFASTTTTASTIATGTKRAADNGNVSSRRGKKKPR